MEDHNFYFKELIDKTSINEFDIPKVLCHICNEVPVHPVRCFQCNRIFCAEFFTPYINNAKQCPNCENGGELQSQLLEEGKQIHRESERAMKLILNQELDAQHQKLFNDLRIVCPNNRQGCTYKVPHSQLEVHVQNCMAQCQYCQKYMTSSALEVHLENCQPYQDFTRMKHEKLNQTDQLKYQQKGSIQQKQARLKLLENEIKEQEMNLEHRKSKLWKTQVLTLMLLAITVVHSINYQQSHQESREIKIDRAQIEEITKNAHYFAGIDKRVKSEQDELRLQDVIDELRYHVVIDKHMTDFFNIDKYRDQLSQNDYFCEIFSQLYCLIIQNEKSYGSFRLDTQLDSHQHHGGHARQIRGLGKQCLLHQYKQHKMQNDLDIDAEISTLTQIFLNESFQMEKDIVAQFFNRLERVIGKLDRSKSTPVIDAIHNLRDEIGVQ